MALASYLPIDRYQALAQSQELPDRATGATLFADISGFTPLTETLAQELGSRRGGEELSRYLNIIYDALVSQVHLYRGSVISFSGDAITCWFLASPGEELKIAAHRALTVARAIQTEMGKIGKIVTPGGKTLTLAVKVAVAAGKVRRFVAGNPEINLIDIMAGSPLVRMADAEHLANKGEVVVSSEVYELLSEYLEIKEWRGAGGHFGVAGDLKQNAVPYPWPELPEDERMHKELGTWLLPAVSERLNSGAGDFLTELRPAVALFMCWTGLDYDEDERVGYKLDAYIRWVQKIINGYEGNLLQVTVGDKGNYLYAVFGAPYAHKNDSERAVKAALELLAPPPELNWVQTIQIGISQGTMRAGAYGGSSCHIYGVLGDEVNLAARLMQAATSGQILVSGRVYKTTQNLFEWKPLQPIKVKGKADPISIYSPLPTGQRQSGGQSVRITAPFYKLPMVGREAEMAVATQRLEEVQQGKGQILAIIAEAGMGKSRLVAEVIRLVAAQGIAGYGGECQSYGVNSSYLVWQEIGRHFFGLESDWSPEQQIEHLTSQIREISLALLPRLPLLGTILNLPISDTELTSSMNEQIKKASREALLVDCIRVRAKIAPLFLVLEDCHWLDPLSHDLLEAIGRAITDLPVLIVVAYRPPELEYLQAPRVSSLPNATILTLTKLTDAQARQLISYKIGQMLPESPAAQVRTNFIERMKGDSSNAREASFTPNGLLVDILTERAEGNPFYLEELLNYLRDRGFDLASDQEIEKLELPDSLHSLVLSRIDQLREPEKVVLKIASVIGRLFRAEWIWGMYPGAGEPEQVKAHLELLSRLDITPLDKPEPELEYLFKHAITQEIAYESLPYALRSTLHGQLGYYIETSYSVTLAQYIDMLAYHFSLSSEESKKREYLLKAGEAAQAAYANTSAIDYYQRLLPLLEELDKIPVLLKFGQVLELVSNWDDAENLYREALRLSRQTSNRDGEARCLGATGGLLVKQKRYSDAEPELREALTIFKELANPAGESQMLTELGEVYRLQGEFGQAHEFYKQSLTLAEAIEDRRMRLAARAKALKADGSANFNQGNLNGAHQLFEESLEMQLELGDKQGSAALLNNLGIVAQFQDDNLTARLMFERSLSQLRELGDRWSVGMLLNNLGMFARDQGNNQEARSFMEESLSLYRQLGDRWGIANVLSSLGAVLIDEQELEVARAYLTESLQINRELGDRTSLAYLLEFFGELEAAEGQAERAGLLAGATMALRDKIGAPLTPAEQAIFDRRMQPALQKLEPARQSQILEWGRTMSLEEAISYALTPD